MSGRPRRFPADERGLSGKSAGLKALRQVAGAPDAMAGASEGAVDHAGNCLSGEDCVINWRMKSARYWFWFYFDCPKPVAEGSGSA